MEVVDRVAVAVFVLLEGLMQLWGGRGIIQRTIFVSAVREGAGDADRADGVESVGVLDDEAFERVHFVFDVCTLVGDVLDDAAHRVSGGGVEGKRIQPTLRAKRGFIFRSVELPIIQIVKQSRELDDEGIRLFDLANAEGGLPDAIDVPPIVPRRVVRKFLLDVVGGLLDDLALVHRICSARKIETMIAMKARPAPVSVPASAETSVAAMLLQFDFVMKRIVSRHATMIARMLPMP